MFLPFLDIQFISNALNMHCLMFGLYSNVVKLLDFLNIRGICVFFCSSLMFFAMLYSGIAGRFGRCCMVLALLHVLRTGGPL